jgi:hypothetical protein
VVRRLCGSFTVMLTSGPLWAWRDSAIGVAHRARNYRPVVIPLHPTASLKAGKATVVFAMRAVVGTITRHRLVLSHHVLRVELHWAAFIVF